MFLLFDFFIVLLGSIVTGTYISIFLIKKIPLYAVSNYVYIFREWALFLIFYIQSFTVTEYLNVKEDTGLFFSERHGSLDHDIRSDAKSTHLLIVISQTEPVLSCINIMNTLFLLHSAAFPLTCESEWGVWDLSFIN